MKLRKSVTLVESDDGAVLLDEASGRYFQLNPSGALILRTLLADGSSSQAIDALMDTYEVERDRASADVDALVTSLRDGKLVT